MPSLLRCALRNDNIAQALQEALSEAQAKWPQCRILISGSSWDEDYGDVLAEGYLVLSPDPDCFGYMKLLARPSED